VAALAARVARLIKDGRQRSNAAALADSRSRSPITVAPERSATHGAKAAVIRRSGRLTIDNAEPLAPLRSAGTPTPS
jgi:hypothetical protein